MEYRLLGRTGLKVSTIALGTMTMGGKGNFAKLGNTDLAEAKRQIDFCLDAGVNLIDTANGYSGRRLRGDRRRSTRRPEQGRVLLATKVRWPADGPNDCGLWRHHIMRACEASLAG